MGFLSPIAWRWRAVGNMESLHQTNVEALLGRIERVRALARRLVRDAASADDLVQDALARAVGRPVVLEGDPWSWIGATLRNLARDRARREERRARREEASSRPEAGEDSATAVANAELQRELVGAVLGLDEPYRTTLLLRFFEDLAPRAIAQRTGRSSAAVKKQLERGLQQLRGKLEQRYGDSGAWAVALLPLVGTKELLAPAALAGAALVWGLSRWVPVLALVALLGVGVRWAATPRPERVEALEAALAPVAGAHTEPERVASSEREQRSAAGVAEASGLADPAPAIPDGGFAARLVDLHGRPLPGLELEWIDRGVRDVTHAPGSVHWTTVDEAQRQDVRGRTDAWGRLEIPALGPRVAAHGAWNVIGRPYVVLDRGLELSPDGAEEHVLVLAPTVRIAGRVVDPEGRPVAGASVGTQARVEQLTTFPLKLRGLGYTKGPEVQTDESGRFDLGAVPTHPELLLTASGEGRWLQIRVPSTDHLDLELVLGPAQPHEPRPVPRVSGWVLESDGRPAPGVEVHLGQERTSSDAQGRFRFEVSAWSDAAFIGARAGDGRFAVASLPARDEALAEGGAGPVVLHLPEDMLRLRGRLVDAQGRAAPGLRVLLFDPTQLGSSHASLEGSPPGRFRDAEVRTDDEGRFALERLQDRPYRLRFLDPETFLVHDVDGVRGGEEEQRFELPSGGLLDELHGQVIDVYGVPVPRARVALQADLDRSGAFRADGRATTTDPQGRFSISAAPWKGLHLVVEGPHAGSHRTVRFALEELDPSGPLLLEVDLQCEVRILSARGELATRLILLDDEDRALTVMEKHPDQVSYRAQVHRARHGGFPLFEVSQRATTLVLREGERELRRIPLRLDPGRRNEIDLDD